MSYGKTSVDSDELHAYDVVGKAVATAGKALVTSADAAKAQDWAPYGERLVHWLRTQLDDCRRAQSCGGYQRALTQA